MKLIAVNFSSTQCSELKISTVQYHSVYYHALLNYFFSFVLLENQTFCMLTLTNLVLFSLSRYVFRIGFNARHHTFFLDNHKVLLAGAMSAYRPADSKKPCQYFLANKIIPTGQYILELYHQEELQSVLHNFRLC